MARLIRTEKEVEGRFEEVWLVVEEDPVDPWPDGPGDVVGRPAPRQDGLQRATGKALYTADLQLPGMLQAAVLRSPHARARVKGFDASHALCDGNGHRTTGNPARRSGWEIHPVYSIDVCSATTLATCKVDEESRWMPLDQWLQVEEEDH